MKERFPNEFDTAYSGEWAGRFRKGTELVNGDTQSRQALIKVDRERYAPANEYGGFVFKEGHDVIYPKEYSGTGEDRINGRVVENRGSSIVVLTEGTVREIPAKSLDLAGNQTKRE